eukprot:COSAG04_NODE_433_length_14482_cov_11.959466_14_plen_95_part_00
MVRWQPSWRVAASPPRHNESTTQTVADGALLQSDEQAAEHVVGWVDKANPKSLAEPSQVAQPYSLRAENGGWAKASCGPTAGSEQLSRKPSRPR